MKLASLVIATVLAPLAACSHQSKQSPQIARLDSNMASTRFEGQRVVSVATGQPFSGVLVARDEELTALATHLLRGPSVGAALLDPSGLIAKIPIKDGVADGDAVLFADLGAPTLSSALTQWEQFRRPAGTSLLKVGTATFVAGELDGVATLWSVDPDEPGRATPFASMRFRRNLPHGVAREFFAGTTAVKREVHFDNGKETGRATERYRDGSVKSETVVSGTRAETKRYFASGKPSAVDRYEDGELVHREAWFPDGTPREKTERGSSTEWYSNGQIKRAPGELEPRPASGVVVEYHDSGAIHVRATLKDGVRDGRFEVFYADGTPWELAELSGGVFVGTRKKWWKNGKLALEETFDQRGGRHGPYKRFYASGTPWELATYVNGAKDGPYKKWWKNGKLAHDYTYKRGKIEGTYKTFYDTGAPWALGEYASGKPVGVMKRWFPDGKLGFEQHHASGKPHGPWRRWYASGQKRLEATYVNGRLEGPFKNWLEDGTVYELATYKNGKKLESSR